MNGLILIGDICFFIVGLGVGLGNATYFLLKSLNHVRKAESLLKEIIRHKEEADFLVQMINKNRNEKIQG